MGIPAILQWIIGTWFVIATNAPMWLKGDKTSPTANYILTGKKGKHQVLDETRYIKNGKQKVIRGYDYPYKCSDTEFVWQGKGLLSFTSNMWHVALRDEAGEWAVVAYTKTAFTPAGADIISRKPTMSDKTLNEIRKKMRADKELARYVDEIKVVGKK